MTDQIKIWSRTYAHSNPVNYTDPSGYSTLTEIMTALSIKFTSGTYQVYALYQSLGTTAVGKVLIEVGQEGLELIIAGDLTIEGVGYSLVEVVIGVAFNDETDLSGIKKSANIVGKSKRPGGDRTGDIDKHGLLSPGTNRAVGYANKKVDKQVQSHHPIQNEWAKKWAKKIIKNIMKRKRWRYF